jgi:hypothetical protein
MKTLADNPMVREVCEKLTVGAPAPFGGLAVVPLLNVGATDPDWLTLEEAVGGKTLEVTEVSERGAVPTLRVVNRGERAVLLLDSEELVGAKQNRVLNVSVLVGAGQTVEIPVSCVEQGRWAYRTRQFQAGKRSLYAWVRRKKAARVHEALRREGAACSDQWEIWADLARAEEAFGTASPTGAMADIFEARARDLEGYERALSADPGQVGALVYGGGEWWGLELLAGPGLFRKAWARLLPGYAMDALLAGAAAEPRETAAERLEAVLEAPVEAFPAVGAGEDYRFRTEGLVGAALVAEGRLAHLMAFPG